LRNLAGIERVHIVGIGGAGMSAIARVLHGWGIAVQGSDRRASALTEALQAEGIDVAIGHAPEHVRKADLVLASSAVPEDNVELAEARAQDIPVTRRPEFLGPLTEGYQVIAVAGAHGKTTVTAMITQIMLAADLDPTYIVGGVMTNLDTNAGAGQGPYFVIEADEYRQTFLALEPSIAVVTNVEFDHPDCYPALRHVRFAFGNFVDQVTSDGLVVACGDDEIAHALAVSRHASGGRVMFYGRDANEDYVWRARDIEPNGQGGIRFDAVYRGEVMGTVSLQVPGSFNAVNALAALTVASDLGVDWSVARAALEQFQGTARRFEVLGEVGGVTVVDDYAHHPTQIRGVLEAARDRYGDRRLVAVWEPHTFSRIRALKDDFMCAFAGADAVVIMPIYAAREPDDGSLTSELLAGQMVHDSVWAGETLDAVVAHLAASVRDGDVVLMLGAGNETLAGERLVERLDAQEKGAARG
jgi:UDP-N-acetylmuramate--alanine ligase